MAVQHATVALTQTAAKITPTFAEGENRLGSSIAFVNETGVAVRVGASGVTTSTGILVAANAAFSMDLDEGEDLYAVCASGSHNLQVLRSGV
jgi:hypothetical protein